MKLKNRLGVYLPLLFIFIIASTVTRTVALFNDYNPISNYFDEKLLVSISGIFAIIGALTLFSFIFVSPKMDIIADFQNPATYIPSGIVSTALLFLAVEIFVLLSKTGGGIFGKAVLSNHTSVLMLASGILALLCVINFFFNAFFAENKNEHRALFGILTVIFLAAYSIYLYFDIKLPLNSPNKAADQISLLFAACFFLFETRISLGIEKWRGYVSFGLVTALLLFYSSVPTLIYYFAKGENISDSLSGAVLSFALFVYITARIILINSLAENKKSENALAVEEMVKKRKEELALPSQARVDSKEGDFSTLGKNYEFNLHLGKSSESENNLETEEDTDSEKEEGEES